MSNATDNLLEAEKMIRSKIVGTVEQRKTVAICKWLFLINEKQNGYLIKCYTTNDDKVRFCVDRGNDCNKDKVGTSFLNINPYFEVGILSIKDTKPYYKRHDKNWCKIPAPISRELTDKEIHEVIWESYRERMEKMKMQIDTGK